jgi:hypothetical protein
MLAVVCVSVQLMSPHSLIACPSYSSRSVSYSRDQSLSATKVMSQLRLTLQALSGKTLIITSQESSVNTTIVLDKTGHPRLAVSRYNAVGGEVAGNDQTAHSSPTVASPFLWTHYLFYSDVKARRCDGTPVPGLLVVEDLINASTGARQLRVSAAPASSVRGGAVFAPLEAALWHTQALRYVTGGHLDNQAVDEFVFPWTTELPHVAEPESSGDPAPPALHAQPAPPPTELAVWVESGSRLPVRWEVRRNSSLLLSYRIRYSDQRPRIDKRWTTVSCLD